MKTGWIPALLCLKFCCMLSLICSTSSALALNGEMERAVVRSMRKVPCMATAGMEALLASSAPGYGPVPASAGPEAGPVTGSVTGQCIEYELHTGKVSYVIQPRHAILLEVGGEVAIKLVGKNLILQPAGLAKEIHCDVLSMTLRSDEEKKEKDKEWERENQPSRHYTTGCYTESGIEFNCGKAQAYR